MQFTSSTRVKGTRKISHLQMANGLPDFPAETIEFKDSLDDETCPGCGWDTQESREDPRQAFNSGILLAYQVEDVGFQVMAGTKQTTMYWLCPKCRINFLTEEETGYIGGMS
jgi:rubredoxin